MYERRIQGGGRLVALFCYMNFRYSAHCCIKSLRKCKTDKFLLAFSLNKVWRGLGPIKFQDILFQNNVALKSVKIPQINIRFLVHIL